MWCTWTMMIIILLMVSVAISAGQDEKNQGPDIAGTVTVTLHIFSGRQNPTWDLDDKQIEALNEKIRAMVPDTSLNKLRSFDDFLGYRGFSIHVSPKGNTNGNAKKVLLVYNNVLDFGGWKPNRKGTEHSLERWLLESGSQAVEDDVKKAVEEDLKNIEEKNQ
jgi:hypothetical protein